MPTVSRATVSRSSPWYSPREISQAAGVSEALVVLALENTPRSSHGYVPHAEAVRIGRALKRTRFSIFSDRDRHPWAAAVPLAVSSTLHVAAFLVAVFVTTLGLARTGAATVVRSEPMRLVFLALPGPGGGGGGGTANATVRIPLTDYGGNQTPSFQPNNVTIPVGGTVNWTNQDQTGHTTTSDDNLWNGGLGPGGSYARTFPTAGTFSYSCTVHPGMTGRVVVQ